MKAVAYARYSSDNQRAASIDAQLRAIGAFAERRGYEITKTYIDEALSGKTDAREQFQVMMDAARSGSVSFDAIIVHEFNRFARNTMDSRKYKSELRQYGIRVLSVLSPLKTARQVVSWKWSSRAKIRCIPSTLRLKP